MAKFRDVVGYCETKQNPAGVWEDVVNERIYTGDILRNSRRWETGTGINDDLNINNSVSIVADAFAEDHFFAIKYVKWIGVYWKVTNVEVQRPRLILTIGGVYNGPTAGSSSTP